MRLPRFEAIDNAEYVFPEPDAPLKASLIFKLDFVAFLNILITLQYVDDQFQGMKTCSIGFST